MHYDTNRLHFLPPSGGKLDFFCCSVVNLKDLSSSAAGGVQRMCGTHGMELFSCTCHVCVVLCNDDSDESQLLVCTFCFMLCFCLSAFLLCLYLPVTNLLQTHSHTDMHTHCPTCFPPDHNFYRLVVVTNLCYIDITVKQMHFMGCIFNMSAFCCDNSLDTLEHYSHILCLSSNQYISYLVLWYLSFYQCKIRLHNLSSRCAGQDEHERPFRV